jgi:4a-hydroxytetrahydrobiopterin dehydratase
MRTFSKIVEQQSTKRYYKISADITLAIKSDSEGEAGYHADSILGGVKEQIDFTINNIEEIHIDQYNSLFESVESPSWIEKDGYLERTFEFGSFMESIDFVNKIAKLSEDNSHHPKIAINFNQVKLLFKTNKEDSITDIDRKMAKKVDDIFNI